MRVLRPFYLLPLVASLWVTAPAKAMESRRVDSFLWAGNPNKPLQDTTVSIVVTKGMSYRELARQAIATANKHLPLAQQKQLSDGLYADNRGEQKQFLPEQKLVNALSKNLASQNVLGGLGAGNTVDVTVSKDMRQKSWGSTPPKPSTLNIPPPLPTEPMTPLWAGGSDDEFARWITQFTQANFPPTTWKETQRANIAPEVVISTGKALGITSPIQQQKFAEKLIRQALEPDVGDPSWWNAVKAAYLEKHPSQTLAATEFMKKIMVKERRILARILIGVPTNARLWQHKGPYQTLFCDNANRLSYTPEELIQVLENTAAASKGEVTFDGTNISITRTVNGQTYQTALTVIQFKRWVEQETDNCPFVPGKAGEQGLIHIMPNLIKNPICGGLNPLIPEQGIVMSFRYLAYLNDLYGNNGYFVDANVFAMYNGGPNIFTSTKVTPERKQAAVNYGNKIANGN